MNISKNFLLQELVPPQIYNSYGDRSTYFVSKEQASMCQGTRDIFGKTMTINNWHSGGPFKERGYRLPNSATGATLSMHKTCMADDFNIAGIASNEVFEYIMNNQAKFMAIGITTLEHPEYATTWTHMDRRWTNLGFILVVKPAQTVLTSGDIVPMDEYFHWEGKKLVPFN